MKPTMRMWLVSTGMMCRQHLLGEHNEIHMFVGAINKHKSMEGYLNNNLLEPSSLKHRHNAIAEEMIKREYAHKSSLNPINRGYLKGVKIDKNKSLKEILRRCRECRKRYEKAKNLKKI